MTAKFTVYEGRDNIDQMLFKIGGAALPIDTITDAEIIFNDESYDSDTYSAYFDWATDGASGILAVKMGLFLPVGRDYNAQVIIYGATTTNGIVQDTVDIKVVANPVD